MAFIKPWPREALLHGLERSSVLQPGGYVSILSLTEKYNEIGQSKNRNQQDPRCYGLYSQMYQHSHKTELHEMMAEWCDFG